MRRIQHRTDKQRTKRRHRLEHRRQHHANAPRGAWFRGVEFRVEAAGFRPIKVERYLVLEPGALRFAETETFGPGGTEPFRDPTFGPTALWINGRYWVYGENPPVGYPSLTLGYGGRIDRGGWSEGTTAFSGGLQVGDARAMQVDGFTFHASRVADTDDYKVFVLHVLRLGREPMPEGAHRSPTRAARTGGMQGMSFPGSEHGDRGAKRHVQLRGDLVAELDGLVVSFGLRRTAEGVRHCRKNDAAC